MFLNKEVKRYQSTKIRKYESTKSPVDESFKVMKYFTRCTDITDITRLALTTLSTTSHLLTLTLFQDSSLPFKHLNPL